MSAGSTDAAWLSGTLAALVAALVAGCDTRTGDPPPPSRHEIVPAPPGARGARAAGMQPEPGSVVTPQAPGTGELEWGEPPAPGPETSPDAGSDAGEAPQGVPL